MGATFFAPVQTGPGAHTVSCTMGTGSFLGVESGRGVTLTPHPLLVSRSKTKLELYLYSPQGPSWPMKRVKPNQKGKVIPTQTWTPPNGSMRLRLPEFPDNWHINVASFTALPTGRLYLRQISLVLISVRSRVDSKAIVLPEGLSQ
jgi:hypothetical protein